MNSSELGSNLSKKIEQLEIWEKIQQHLQQADQLVADANRAYETAEEKYGFDEFDDAKKCLDDSNKDLDLAEIDIADAKQEIVKGILPQSESKELTNQITEVEGKIMELRANIFIKNEDVQWLINLEVEIRNAEEQFNWELYRLYIVDALAFKNNSAKFIRYLEKYENIKSDPKFRAAFKPCK